jgi:hypothetical protein
VLYHFAREAAGAAGTRLSLRPLFSGAEVFAQLGRAASRESGRMPLNSRCLWLTVKVVAAMTIDVA